MRHGGGGCSSAGSAVAGARRERGRGRGREDDRANGHASGHEKPCERKWIDRYVGLGWSGARVFQVLDLFQGCLAIVVQDA